MKPILARIVGGLLLAGVISAIYLPFFESFSYDSTIDSSFSVISERPNPHQGGHFGGGFYVIRNGFGSIIALFNCGIGVLLFIILFLTPSKRALVNLLLVLFLFSQLLMLIGMIAAPMVLSDPDKMLAGYFLMMACEIGLFRLVYRRIKHHHSIRVRKSRQI